MEAVTKIKGGRWTVFRFTLVSIAYTSAWIAVSSDLHYYSLKYGPQVLLLLNISYYAPGIPLLIASSFLDQYLERTVGVARTIFGRLVVGLLGYGCISAAFPFLPSTLAYLLVAVMALGAFSGIAFSASYQLVSRFANKNVIALGLGCALSGPVVLVMQLAYRMNAAASNRSRVLLYETIAGIVAAGLWATVSLLLRHWDAIEASTKDAEATETEPLLSSEEGLSVHVSSPRRSLLKHPSLPPLIAYHGVEPYSTYLDAEEEWPSYLGWTLFDPTAAGGTDDRSGGRPGLGASRSSSAPIEGEERRRGVGSEWPLTLGPAAVGGGGMATERREGVDESGAAGTGEGTQHRVTDTGSSGPRTVTGEDMGHNESPLRVTVSSIWPALAAVGIQSGISLTLFPFFTYLPSSGMLGASLSRTLFYGRIFTDIIGRMLPRVKALHPSSIWPVFTLALIKLATEPLFFVYLKSPEAYHSDVLAAAYVGAMWMAGGYVNTAANMLAPRLVPPALKSTAAGMMALVYQAGHFLGLALATVLVRVLYGDL